MLAKFGITSPFNKRKIKEINSTKQMLQQQQQPSHSNQSGSMLSHNASSGIPTPKKIQSNLPVFYTNIHRNSNLISSTDSSFYNSSKKSYNSSRSGSPNSTSESTTSTSQLNKQSAASKLPQFQISSISSNSMSKDNRKSGFVKSSKTSIPQCQLTSGATSSKLTNSKIPPSSSIHLNNLANKQNSDKSKKIGLVQNQSLQSQSQSQMPLLSSNLSVQGTNTTKLSQAQTKKNTSTFGLSKSTKTSSKNESSENKSSKIPSTLSGIKPQLKSPSIQFNSNSPLKIPVGSRITTNNSAKNSPLNAFKKCYIPLKPKCSLTMNTNSPSTLDSTSTAISMEKSEEKKQDENKESDLDEEILGSMNDINEDFVNDEDFQNFLSSNLEDENIENCKTESSNKNENLSITSELPSPPCSSELEASSPSVTINHINMSVNSINLNSFGRSNTLDRKLKPLNQDASVPKFKNNTFRQNGDDYKEQRNSLNIQLKSPSCNSYRSSFQNSSKRPLSQEPIMEITAEIPIDTCDAFCTNFASNSGFSQTGTISTIQKLSYELENAKNRIISLTNQLNSNAQLVYTLEQTISAMSTKLQNESKTCQKKDAMIGELKSYIDHLHIKYPKVFEGEKIGPLSPFNLNRHNSNESLNSLNSMLSHRSYQSSVVTTNTESCNDNFSKKKKSWLRSSFNRAFRKNSSRFKNENSDIKSFDGKSYLSDVEEKEYIDKIGYGEFSLPNSPMHQQIVSRRNEIKSQDECEEFQRILRDKEIKLTDIRLEALATAHQLDQTKEENLKMRIEIEQLKSENLRMHQILSQQSQILHHTPTSISSPSPSASVISSSSNNSKMNISLSNSSQNVENLVLNHTSTSSASSISVLKSPISNVLNSTDSGNNEGKRVMISIYIGNLENPLDDCDQEQFNGQILIGTINLTTRTKWDNLDFIVKNFFNDYLNKLEANSIESGGLGIGVDSIDFYIVGDMFRKPFDSEQTVPDLLPYGYLVGNFTNIVIKLKDASSNSVDSLCYDTLVPKNVMLRYISIVLEFKNLLLCGPSGTCKTYIARKIAEYLIKKENKNINDTIIYLNVENKTIKDLKMYLNNLEYSADPLVLILDNLQFISNIHEAFSDYFKNNLIQTKLFYIIGTINQSNVTALNLHPNFKWVLFVNHTEPVKNYLTRSLERRLVDQISKMNENKTNQLEAVIEWIPKLWIHVNRYIETYNSVDLCIGPKKFCDFPFDFKQSSEWFVDFWNNALVPLIINSVHEGTIVYGTRLDWEDPKLWLANTLPWLSLDGAILGRLKSIAASQVGLNQSEDQIIQEEKRRYSSFPNTPSKIMNRNSHENDKLLNMLMKLQEATGLNGQNHFMHVESNASTAQNIKSLTYSNNNFNKINLIES